MSDGPFSIGIPAGKPHLGSVGGPARDAIILEITCARLNAYIDYMSIIVNRLENTADGIFGSQPPSPSGIGGGLKMSNKIDNLNIAIDTLERVITRLDRVQERLSAL